LIAFSRSIRPRIVAGHGWAISVMANPESSAVLKCGAIRTAILLARAQKA
jgi:hypothetical protein